MLRPQNKYEEAAAMRRRTLKLGKEALRRSILVRFRFYLLAASRRSSPGIHHFKILSVAPMEFSLLQSLAGLYSGLSRFPNQSQSHLQSLPSLRQSLFQPPFQGATNQKSTPTANATPTQLHLRLLLLRRQPFPPVVFPVKRATAVSTLGTTYEPTALPISNPVPTISTGSMTETIITLVARPMPASTFWPEPVSTLASPYESRMPPRDRRLQNLSVPRSTLPI
jgi:hypothetical protein